ncbi:DUF6933 domain-containing protein [Pseudalkalibacillus caeni]|uniref:DUF6933 domain-containing protein n=1 Tax=Exobacillus caeni TaxID=2574798 RepID=A0A5R9F2K6_9BACL|nr:hypothetical protein [Pseudalkalibacillus caeni]TLS36769.1 hypothetical protein FCL54_12465 [Pseudalkalibacillus caeni]
MITIQCTKKLIDNSPFEIEPVKEETDPFFSWHAHLFFFNRKKCVIVMNNKTRYNFVLYGLKKKEFDNFSDLFKRTLTKNLRAEQIPEEQIKKYIRECDSFIHTKTSDRSIISQINEILWFAKDRMEEDKMMGIETDFIELNRFLNDIPMTKLNGFPNNVMCKEMESL